MHAVRWPLSGKKSVARDAGGEWGCTITEVQELVDGLNLAVALQYAHGGEKTKLLEAAFAWQEQRRKADLRNYMNDPPPNYTMRGRHQLLNKFEVIFKKVEVFLNTSYQAPANEIYPCIR